MSRDADSNRDQRRAAIRDRLLAATERLIAEGESFTEISVERIAAAGGISRSTFYVYFQDKGELVRGWFAQINQELEAAARPWWSIDGSSTRDDLRAALAQIIGTYRPHAPLMGAVYDTAAYDPLVREEVGAMMTRNIASLRNHIRSGQDDGWIAESLPAAETAAWLMWMAERGQHQLISAATDEEVDALVDAYADIVWNALYARAPAHAAA